MELQIEHIAPYLPYGLKGVLKIEHRAVVRLAIQTNNKNKEWGISDFIYGCLPILRPISDLKKEIDFNGQKVVPIDAAIPYKEEWHDFVKSQRQLLEDCLDYGYIDLIPYGQMKTLLSMHIDIFGLIPQGLAIDINTLTETL